MNPQPPAAPPPPTPIPWVSGTIFVGSVAVFVVGRLVPGLDAWLWLHGPRVAGGDWWRPFTATFVHGDLIHIVFNMMAVVSLGREVERAIGSFRFLITSVVGAMGTAIAVMAWSFDQRMVGASGVILSWAGALLPIASQTGRRQLGIWLVQVAVISLLPFVSAAGHLGGFLAGLPCGWVMRRPRPQFQTAAPMLVFAAAIALYLVGRGPA